MHGWGCLNHGLVCLAISRTNPLDDWVYIPACVWQSCHTRIVTRYIINLRFFIERNQLSVSSLTTATNSVAGFEFGS